MVFTVASFLESFFTGRKGRVTVIKITQRLLVVTLVYEQIIVAGFKHCVMSSYRNLER